MSTPGGLFVLGGHQVDMRSIKEGETSNGPPKPLLIASPSDKGKYPVLVLLHGYMLYNYFYKQLMEHVASHGYVVVAPQLYCIACCDATKEVVSAAEVINWLGQGLRTPSVLPNQVEVDLSKVALAGHSRGGKVAFAVALGRVPRAPSLNVKLSTLIGIDPVDGACKGKQTKPAVLTYTPESFDLRGMASMVLGTGLGEAKGGLLCPPCAPHGLNHSEFFTECQSPTCHMVAKDYGHMDMLDDDTPGLRGKVTYNMCKNGDARKPMRMFVGGAVVAFLEAKLQGQTTDLDNLKNHPETAPVDLVDVVFR